MTKEETIAILKAFNAWRRSNDDVEVPSPTEIGRAIDSAVMLLEGKEPKPEPKGDWKLEYCEGSQGYGSL